MAAVTASTDNRFWQFSKTKMCKFEVLGRCKKGHPECGYAHSKDQLRSTGTFHKTKLCRFMKTGHCALGTKCNFAHSNFELRSAEDAIEEDSMLQKMPDGGLMLPPGLGQWETPSVYENYADTDLNALAHALDMMLTQNGETLGAVKDQAFDVPGVQTQASGKAAAPALRHDAPAYIRLPSASDSSRFGPDQLGTLNFDYLNAGVSSDSTRSPPQGDSPPTSPSPTGSGRSSGKSSNHKSSAKSGSGKASKEHKKSSPSIAISSAHWDYTGQEAAMASFYNEGWDASSTPLGGFGSMWTPYNSPAAMGSDPRLAFGAFGGDPGLAMSHFGSDMVNDQSDNFLAPPQKIF